MMVRWLKMGLGMLGKMLKEWKLRLMLLLMLVMMMMLLLSLWCLE